MSTGLSAGAVGEMVRDLADDGALFPPTELSVGSALLAHRSYRGGPYARLLGRFLCAASRLGELQRSLGERERLRLGLVKDTGAAGVAEAVAQVYEDRRLTLESVEVPLSPEAELSAAAHEALRALGRLPSGVHGFMELPRVQGWRDALALIAARRRGAKLRTGGLVAEAFPTEAQVASFVQACVAEGAAFKCAGGPHHALRLREDRTGLEQHGFLNILVATCQAVTGAPLAALTDIVGERDPHDLLELLQGVGSSTIRRARRHFMGFGCRAFEQVVDDLTGLGLVEKLGG